MQALSGDKTVSNLGKKRLEAVLAIAFILKENFNQFNHTFDTRLFPKDGAIANNYFSLSQFI